MNSSSPPKHVAPTPEVSRVETQAEFDDIVKDVLALKRSGCTGHKSTEATCTGDCGNCRKRDENDLELL